MGEKTNEKMCVGSCRRAANKEQIREALIDRRPDGGTTKKETFYSHTTKRKLLSTKTVFVQKYFSASVTFTNSHTPDSLQWKIIRFNKLYFLWTSLSPSFEMILFIVVKQPNQSIKCRSVQPIFTFNVCLWTVFLPTQLTGGGMRNYAQSIRQILFWGKYY